MKNSMKKIARSMCVIPLRDLYYFLNLLIRIEVTTHQVDDMELQRRQIGLLLFTLLCSALPASAEEVGHGLILIKKV